MTSIPINLMTEQFGAGIAVGRASVENSQTFEQAAQPHRDDYHLFYFQEKGTTTIEIDFQKHLIKPSTVIYINPNQVHSLLTFENVTASFWVINNENLNPEYLKLLEEITPAKPLLLKKEVFGIVYQAISLCINLSKRNQERLYHSLLKDSCNTLVGLVASQYLAEAKSIDTLSRFELITRSFKAILERDFCTIKKPAAYARSLHITTTYLNECVKNASGHSVSYHIQHRIILEAKRLLYHSNSSIKEISAELGYDDHPYFSRLFTKIAGMSPLAFRNKNID